MSKPRKQHSAEFKAKVALDAYRGLKTAQQLAHDYAVHPTQINQWKKQLRDGVASLFRRGQDRAEAGQAAELTALYEKIGRLNMELDWLKKKVDGIS